MELKNWGIGELEKCEIEDLINYGFGEMKILNFKNEFNLVVGGIRE